jgi:hypothetical protein
MKEEGDSITPPCIEPYMATFRLFLKNTEEKRIRDLQKTNKNKLSEPIEIKQVDPMDF